MDLYHIRDREFSIVLRGYNKKEVRDFLDTVAKICEELFEENKKLSEKIEQLQKRLDEYKLKEEKLNTLLTSAEKKASVIVDQSQKEARIIVKEAQVKAKQIIEEGNKKLKNLKLEIEKLSRQKENFIYRFKKLLSSQAEFLKFFEEGTYLSTNPRGPLPSQTSHSKSRNKIVFDD